MSKWQLRGFRKFIIVLIYIKVIYPNAYAMVYGIYIYGTIFRCWVGVCVGMLCGREHVDNKTDSRTILFWCGGKFYFKFGMTCKNICKRKRIQRNNKSLILACNLILLGHEHGANTYTPVFFRVSLIYCSIYRLRKKKMAEK